MSSQLLKVKNLVGTLKADERALRALKKVNPRDRFVLICPDHHNAKVGLGFQLLNCKPAEEIYDQASSILKRDILRLCLEDPDNELESLTSRQVATYVTNHATIARLRSEDPHKIQFIKACGGVGVGFINGLVFSGAMSFRDGLDIVNLRAKAMERASKLSPNATIRVKTKPGTNRHKICRAAREHCLKSGLPSELAVCSVSRQLGPAVIEISGHELAIQFLEQSTHLFEFKFIRRLSQLAWHTDLMKPAELFIEGYVKHKSEERADYLKDPVDCSVYSATCGRRLRYIDHIKTDLARYTTRPILVEQLFQTLYSRPTSVPQPNTLILWDRQLLKDLRSVNRRAWAQAKLVEA